MPAPAKYPGVAMEHAPSMWLPKPLMDAARAKAKKDGDTVSGVLRDWLIEASGVRVERKEAKS